MTAQTDNRRRSRSPDPLPVADLSELERLAGEATAATQWGATGWTANYSASGPGAPPKYCVHANGIGSFPIGWTYRKEDAAFIAASRAAVPAMLARIRELEAALEPFAEQAAAYDQDDEDHMADWPTFKVGDFRRARSALTQERGR